MRTQHNARRVPTLVSSDAWADASEHACEIMRVSKQAGASSTPLRERPLHRVAPVALQPSPPEQPMMARNVQPTTVAEIFQEAVHGRSTAVHAAREEARYLGRPWSHSEKLHNEALVTLDGLDKLIANRPDVFSSLFIDDRLRPLLDLATVAMRRRVTSACQDSCKARADSAQSTEELVARCKRYPPSILNATAMQITLTLLAKSHRVIVKLCHIMAHVDKEAMQAQQTYISDITGMSMRLTAQRDAMANILAPELADSEARGDQIADMLRESSTQRLSEVWKMYTSLRTKFEAERTVLQEQLAQSVSAQVDAEKALQPLPPLLQSSEEAMARLEADKIHLREALALSQAQHATDVRLLRVELGRLEAEKDAQNAASEKAAALRLAVAVAESHRFGARVHAEQQRALSSETALARLRDETRRENNVLEAALKQSKKEAGARPTVEEVLELRARLNMSETRFGKVQPPRSAGSLTRMRNFGEVVRIKQAEQRKHRNLIRLSYTRDGPAVGERTKWDREFGRVPNLDRPTLR